jgi:exosortase
MNQPLESGTSATSKASVSHPSAILGGWSWWIVLVVVIVVILATYSQEMSDLLDAWSDNPDYSHGYLVIPVAVAILYRRWPGADKALSKAWPWGWFLVVASLAARSYWYESGRPWLEQITLIPLVFGLALALGGWGLMRWAWPALAYLVFMIPLPGWLNQTVSMPLQKLATVCTTWVVRLTGLWVMAEGNVIYVGDQPLEVARACNGLSMLMSLAATVVAMVLLVPMSTWKRVVLLLSIVPVALLCNVLRISATAWSYHLFGAEVGEKYAHDFAGLLMMPTALVLVFLELLLLSWLVIEQEEEVHDRPLSSLVVSATAPPPPPPRMPKTS